MSKVKDGFATRQEAADVLTRDRQALEKMKRIEASLNGRLNGSEVGSTKITTTNKLEKSPLLNYIKTQL